MKTTIFKPIASKINRFMSGPLVRFSIAGIVASVVAFMMILFMRYLVMGYDDSTSAALTRYISLPSFIISRNNDDIQSPGKRPGDLPAIPVIDEDDIKQESADFLDENTLGLPAMSTPEGKIEQDILLPDLESEPETGQEKL